MILEKLREKVKFSVTERTIADYLLDNLDKVTDLTPQLLADETYSSKSSVWRLCQKVGYSNFQECMYQMAEESREILRIQRLVSSEPITKKTTLKEIPHITETIYESAIASARMVFDFNQLRRVVNLIQSAEKIEFYGSGITSSIADMVAFKWMTIGKDCVVFNGINEHYLAINKNRTERIAILLSFTGMNVSICNAAKTLKNQNILTIGIGGKREGEGIWNYCTEYIVLNSGKMILSIESVTAITVMNYVLDIIFFALLSANYETSLESSLEVYEARCEEVGKYEKE